MLCSEVLKNNFIDSYFVSPVFAPFQSPFRLCLFSVMRSRANFMYLQQSRLAGYAKQLDRNRKYREKLKRTNPDLYRARNTEAKRRYRAKKKMEQLISDSQF